MRLKAVVGLGLVQVMDTDQVFSGTETARAIVPAPDSSEPEHGALDADCVMTKPVVPMLPHPHMWTS